MGEIKQQVIDAICGAIYHYESHDVLPYQYFGKTADLASDKIDSIIEETETRYKRLLYWALSDQVDNVPWRGEFEFDHRQGLATFIREESKNG